MTVAATANLTISGQIIGLPGGTLNVGPLSLSSAAANGQIQWVVLQSGANTITTPASPSPTGCIIVLPATNTSVTTLKGVSGDTGIAIGKTTTQVLTWDPTAAPATFVLSSVSTQTGLATMIIFF